MAVELRRQGFMCDRLTHIGLRLQVKASVVELGRHDYKDNALFNALTSREQQIVLFHDKVNPRDALQREQSIDVSPT